MVELSRSIPVSDIAHPLVDQVGESGGRGWSLTESRAPVVILDAWRIDLLRRSTAEARELVLATDETSALTPALVHAWREAGAHWLVRNSDGGLRDGFTGRPLLDIADLWSPPDSPQPAEIAVRHLNPQPLDALELTAVVSVRMPARGSSLLGRSVTELFASVGDGPQTWGTDEPALRSWDAEDLTRAGRKRMPHIQLVVRGAHSAAVVRVRRTRHGLEETTYAALAAAGGTDVGPQAAAGVTEALAQIATSAMPLVGLVLAQRGRTDLLRAPFLRPPATPIAMLIGPPVAKELGINTEGERRRVDAEPVGRRKLPSLLYRLSTNPDDHVDAWRSLDQVLDGFDPTTLTGTFGTTTVPIELLRPPSL